MAGNFSGFGSAISDLFSSQGQADAAAAYGKEADAFGKAAGMAGDAAQESEQATRVALFQTHRKVFQTIGQQQSQYAGAGVQSGGSAMDVLRNSQMEGNLAEAGVNIQGAITKTSYLEQQQAFIAQQDAAIGAEQQAKAASQGSMFAGIFGIVGSLMSFL